MGKVASRQGEEKEGWVAPRTPPPHNMLRICPND